MRCAQVLFFVGVAQLGSAVAAFDTVAISERNKDAIVITFGVRPGTGVLVQGSGSCVHLSGIILTTAHQVKGLEGLRIRLRSGAELPCRILALDDGLDMALLKTDSPLPKAVVVGDAGDLKMGSPLMAITSPEGLEFSAVSGIVSSMDRQYEHHSVIQTDLPFSPGSSGGPVFDEAGRLMGIVAGRVEKVAGATLVNPVNNAYAMLRAHDIPVHGGRTPAPTLDEIMLAGGFSDVARAAMDLYNQGVGATALERRITAYKGAVALAPEFFEAWFNLAVAYTTAHETDRAIEAYGIARRIRPRAVAVHRNLGRLFLTTDDVRKAVEAFGEAVALRQDDASCRNDLGDAYRRLKAFGKAEEEFKAALALQPGYAAAHFNLALTYANDGREAKAIGHFEEYLRQNPGARDAAEVRVWIEELRNGN